MSFVTRRPRPPPISPVERPTPSGGAMCRSRSMSSYGHVPGARSRSGHPRRQDSRPRSRPSRRRYSRSRSRCARGQDYGSNSRHARAQDDRPDMRGQDSLSAYGSTASSATRKPRQDGYGVASGDVALQEFADEVRGGVSVELAKVPLGYSLAMIHEFLESVDVEQQRPRKQFCS